MTRALAAPPCEHHAGMVPTPATALEHGAHGEAHAAEHAEHHAPTDGPHDADAGACECIGHCASGTAATAPGAQFRLTVTVGEQRTARIATATARIADRVPFALPWATAPPA